VDAAMKSANVELGEVCSFLSGFAFKAELFSSEPIGLPLIRIRDVLPGRSNTYYSGPYQSEYLVQKGDILIGMDGEFNRERWKSDPALLNQRVCKPIAKSDVLDDGYLYHVLPLILKRIEDETPFVTVKHLSVAKLRGAHIPLPPLEEQRRIAAILDKVNDIQGRQQEASNMIQAVPRSLFLTLFGDPRVNSRSWPEHSLGELGRVVTGSTPPSSEQGMFDGPVPFITPGDLGSGKEPKRSLTESGSLRSRTVKRGSALVCCIGATIGKMDIARQDSAFNQQINAVEWGDSIIGEYGIEALRFFSRNIATAGASTTLPILKKSSFEKLRLPVPPVELQREYVRQLKAIHAHSGSLHQALQIAASLKQSLMSRAFSGEL